ncbi:MAG TPA: T9SS type A sorting domain-containing protein [Chitinophagales bacterium]|nr:T9SS type A sorting domain-containing protein [Chitinophagales bacterium]
MLNQKAFCQAGDLDSTFGNNGIVVPFLNGNGNATDIAVQQDGKILVCGYSGVDGFTVIRLNESGTPDSSFGYNGISTTVVGGGNNLDGKIAIQSDGKIVVAGNCATFDGYWSCALLRLNADGMLDNTFGIGGKVVYSLMDPHQYFNSCREIAIGPDQKITTAVITNTLPNNQVFGVARFTSSGVFDNTFGWNGIALTPIGNAYAAATSIRIQPDGKTVVGGGSYSPTDQSFAIARYNVNGTLDNSFNGDGMDTLYFYNPDTYDGNSIGYDFFIQPNGMIVISGNTSVSNSTIGHIAIARYTTAGNLDNSFGTGGKKILQVPGYPIVNAFSVTGQADSKIVIAGCCSPSTTNFKLTTMVVRIFQDGSLDTGFGVNGIATFDVDSMPDAYILSVGMDQQQRIVGAGYSYELGFMALRYLSGLEVGIIDLAIDQLPVLFYPNPVKSEAIIRYTITDDYNITISLYDMLGREVQKLFNEVPQLKGMHTMKLLFNPSLPSGEYLLAISDGRNSQGIRLIIQR